jgi:hypothetical protein
VSEELSQAYGLTAEQLEAWLPPAKVAKHPQIRCRKGLIVELIEAADGPLHFVARRVGGSDAHPRYVVQLKHAIPAVHQHQRVIARRKLQERAAREELGLSLRRQRELSREPQSILHPAAAQMLSARQRAPGRKAG